MWSSMVCLWWNTLSQWGHLSSRPLWHLMWTRKVRSLFSHLPHSWHCFCSLFSTCEYKCPFSVPWVGNTLAHIWHINSHTLSCTYLWWAVAPAWLANLWTKIYRRKVNNIFLHFILEAWSTLNTEVKVQHSRYQLHALDCITPRLKEV
jgi:hypothetical protein